MTQHPPILGLGAALAEDPETRELYRRQQAALEPAANAVRDALIDTPGAPALLDGRARRLAVAAVQSYLVAMREPATNRRRPPKVNATSAALGYALQAQTKAQAALDVVAVGSAAFRPLEAGVRELGRAAVALEGELETA